VIAWSTLRNDEGGDIPRRNDESQAI